MFTTTQIIILFLDCFNSFLICFNSLLNFQIQKIKETPIIIIVIK
ncbi:hypothetical protein [Candidatus Phytoplasma sp. AldY-WA1]|nr:hypothetical protein [Candidatus Phytoplasma sp. AldY-WA1]